MNCRPWALATALSSRATSAEAVVWSTNTAPGFIPAKAPFGTQRDAAQVIVVANAAKNNVSFLVQPGMELMPVFKPFWPLAPVNSAHHASDFVAVRL